MASALTVGTEDVAMLHHAPNKALQLTEKHILHFIPPQAAAELNSYVAQAIALFMVSVFSVLVYAGEDLKLCVGSVKKSESNILLESLNNEDASLLDYYIQVEDGPKIKSSPEKGFEYPIESMNPKQLVKIRNETKNIQSFWINFDTYKTSSLCLWFSSQHGTWSVWRLEDAGHFCACDE